MNPCLIIAALLLLMSVFDAKAADKTDAKKLKTGYYAVDKFHASCCAVMLKHALTNISDVVTADIFTTNQIVRIRYRPTKKVLKDIEKAFRAEIVEAKRLKSAPVGKLK